MLKFVNIRYHRLAFPVKLLQFYDILSSLPKWNIIVFHLGLFWKMTTKKLPFSSLNMHCACKSVGSSVLFFSSQQHQAPCMFCFVFKVAHFRLKQIDGIHLTSRALIKEYPETIYFLKISSQNMNAPKFEHRPWLVTVVLASK